MNALQGTYSGAQMQLNEERAAGDQQLLQNEVEGAEAKGSAITAGGQAGVDGSASLRGVLQDFHAQQGRQDSAVQTNFQTGYGQIKEGLTAAQSGGQGQVNSVPQAIQPSPFTAGLQILSSGVQGLGTYERDSYLSHPWNNVNPGITQSQSSY